MNEDLENKKNIKREERQAKKQHRLTAKAREPKPSTFKNFIKEIKRIIWPKSSKSWKWFGITISFLIVMGVFCFLVTLGFTGMWNALGIKI
ncbi:preprotein translocase subunit SecE [Metamycoplasma equirhinis]|uniref:preprotein translocase subunit SecE n=1 Tax=Metamycoplasma equirhinis TaxID=92402 RepID=UPI003593EAB0